jgi:hypothetical protein
MIVNDRVDVSSSRRHCEHLLAARGDAPGGDIAVFVTGENVPSLTKAEAIATRMGQDRACGLG